METIPIPVDSRSSAPQGRKSPRSSLLQDNALYLLSREQQKILGPEERSTLQRAFKNYDKNGDCSMDEKEFKSALIDMGMRKLSDEDAHKMLLKADKSKDGYIQWGEFVNMMISLRKDDPDKFGQIGSDGKASVENVHGGRHQYSTEQCKSFASIINWLLKEDTDCGNKLPIDDNDPQDIFHAFDNGTVMCKLLLKIDADCLDSRAINKQSSMNAFQIKENIQMAIAACKGIGIKMIGLGTADFIHKTPHLVLTFVWQALRLATVSNINIKDIPEILRLAKEGETVQQLSKLKVEEILIRWVNYHLHRAGREKRIHNLKDDLTDGEAMLYVLNQIDKDNCPIGDAMLSKDNIERATVIVDNSVAMGVPKILKPPALTLGDQKINTLFLAYVFNTKHGIPDLSEDEITQVGVLDDDIEGSREERVFRLWINSLNIDGVHLENLFDEISDGVLLCKVVHKLDPAVIDWKAVELKPRNDFGRNGNCGQAIAGSKKMGLKMIGIGGSDIVKGVRKDILGTCWSLCKLNYLKLIGGKTEKELVQWANSKVHDESLHIKDLKDKSLASGLFLIKVCQSIEPRYVNEDLITAGETDEDKTLNAKYGITLTRKLEGVVFCVWEDLVKVNPKQNLIIYATLYDIAKHYFVPMNPMAMFPQKKD